MSTDFNNNLVIVSGTLRPSQSNTPLDVRTRIESIDEVELIPIPFVGMIFYVIEENKFYFVKTLKSKIVGGREIQNMLIDEFEELAINNECSFDVTILENYTTKEFAENELVKKVDKEEGKSLMDINEIERLAKVDNYDDSELKELIDEEKPYLADVAAYPTSKFLFACGQPMTVEPNIGQKYDADKPEDAVAFIYRWADGFESIVIEKEIAAKVYLVGGYGNKNVGVKRAIPQTNMIVRDVKIKGLVGGNYFEGMIGHVNMVAENCEFVSVLGAGWCGAAVNGVKTRMNVVDDINIKFTNCKVSSTFFGGSQGNGVTDDVHVELNNCDIGWLTAGGSNGMTRNAEIIMNGGNVKVAQSTNRGIVHKAKFVLNDGIVEKLYFGGETEDTSVTGMIEDGFVELNGGQVNKFCFGTNNGIEMNVQDIKGSIVDCIVNEGDISMLSQIKNIETHQLIINNSGVEIELPDADDFCEVHIFIQQISGEISIINECKWQSDMPELIEGNFYEFIFTKVGNVWLAGCVEYK